MRELTRNEKEYIAYEVGGYEIDFQSDGAALDREVLVDLIYIDFVSKNKAVDAFRLTDDTRFAGEENIKKYINEQLDTCDPEMFK